MLSELPLYANFTVCLISNFLNKSRKAEGKLFNVVAPLRHVAVTMTTTLYSACGRPHLAAVNPALANAAVNDRKCNGMKDRRSVRTRLSRIDGARVGTALQWLYSMRRHRRQRRRFTQGGGGKSRRKWTRDSCLVLSFDFDLILTQQRKMGAVMDGF